MRKAFSFLLLLALLLTGCTQAAEKATSNSEEQDEAQETETKEKESEENKAASEDKAPKEETSEDETTPVDQTATEEKTEQEQEAAPENEATHVIQKAEYSLEGVWSWNIPETESALNISNQDDDSFDFSLHVVSGGHVGDISGTAKLDGNTATFIEELDEPLFPEQGSSCTLTFQIAEDKISVEESANCLYFHGMAVAFSGDYFPSQEPAASEDVAENDIKVFHTEANKLYINGVTLNDDKSTIINKLGTPDTDAADEFGFYDTILTYGNLEIGLDQDTVSGLTFQTDKQFFEKEFISNFQGEKFISSTNDVTYLYESLTGHLIFAKEENGNFLVYLGYADGNFEHGVNEGSIQPMED